MPVPRCRCSHCVKSDRIWSFSGLYFPTFGLNSYLVQMRENTYRKNSEYGQFLRSSSGLCKMFFGYKNKFELPSADSIIRSSDEKILTYIKLMSYIQITLY